jgi:hypothetical protein
MNPWRKSFGIWVPDRRISDTRGMVGIGIPTIGAVAASRRRTSGGTPTWYDAIDPASTDTTSGLYSYAIAQTIIAGQSGNCTKLRAYIRYSNGSTIKLALFNSSFALIASAESGNLGGAESFWSELAVTSVAVTSAATYYIAYISPATQNRYLASQPSGTSYFEATTTYATFPPNTYSGSAYTAKMAVGMYIE